MPKRLPHLLLLRSAAPFALILLGACGGGSGGGGPISTPTPPAAPAPTTPAPSPTPAPAPTPADFDTAEVRRSDGPLAHDALTAWLGGHSGDGITIAVVDSGIDPDNPEFAGRLSPLSRDIYAENRALEGESDHGTQVALFAAAARDDYGIVGMAYDATVLALRTDQPGSCASDCLFNDSAIADSVNFAASNGAKVINISLGGEGASQRVLDAVRNAVGGGALVVVSAGNESELEPTDFARQLASAGNGGVIIAGSVDDSSAISDFSNRAGGQAANYLSALGEGLCCVYEDGELYVDADGYRYIVSGTSYSAPLISGAAALLAQAFPNLTGREIAEILLDSARDAGAPGTDAVYGRGILDIAAAFAPSGTTSLAGSDIAVSAGSLGGTMSGAMGDALNAASLPTVVLDEYSRAYRADLARSLRGAAPVSRLGRALAGQTRQMGLATEAMSLSVSIDASGKAGEMPHIAQLRLASDDAGRARVLAARIALKLSPDTQFAFAYAQGADGLVAQLQGQDWPAFMVAPAAGDDAPLYLRSDASIALRREIGAGWGLTIGAMRGEIMSEYRRFDPVALAEGRRRHGVIRYGAALDRDFGALETALGLDWMREENTLLGSRLPASFGSGGADTLFVNARAGLEIAQHWRMGAELRQGWTRAAQGGLIASGSSLASRAWSVELAYSGAVPGGGSVGLRIAQSLRVESGSLGLNLPVGWSHETMLPEYGRRSLPLSPEGREILGEMAWRGRLLSGDAAASLFYRRDPGHYSALADDYGFGLRWSRDF
ncbi:Extracellular serine protease precursor [Croceibacterium atlanticum]|uniref:Extracellular serine protease n=2 Tax=Croceibacterium atlanticum TaxID=1267766 RepID=A0A0F7KXV6_9SPHN|nr:S8 family peptidase [Croceibacterium atlanticum]AKH44076.1 Extracellular serine protease precursor [Croceibacterium atlanticum]